MGVVRLEGEAVAFAVAAVADGVLEAAGLADDRDGAVAQRDHLGQAAGLALRGHQEEVGAGVDLSREARVEAQLDAELVRVPLGDAAEVVLVGAVAGAEDDHADFGVVQKLIDDGGDEVEALVGDEP